MKKETIKKFLIYSCKILLLVIAISLLIFAFLSGAENSGALKNMPNALPWVILLIFVLVAFRWQIAGGILVIFFGIFTIIFFGAIEFLWILFLISLPIVILGSILALAGASDR